MRSRTSPTSTETTGRSHARASFTTLGDPSCREVSSNTSLPFIQTGTSLWGTPLSWCISVKIPQYLIFSTAAWAKSKRLHGSPPFVGKSTWKYLGSQPSLSRHSFRLSGLNSSRSTPLGMILTLDRSTWDGSASYRFLDFTTILAACFAALCEANTPTRAINFLNVPERCSPNRSDPQNETTVGRS